MIKPNANNFKLIADSVQGLRSFLDKLDVEDVPESLITALEKLIIKIEPQEYNLIMTNNSSKIKLFNDWKSYPERFEKEKDEIIFWEEKEVKNSAGNMLIDTNLNYQLENKTCIQGIQLSILPINYTKIQETFKLITL